MPAAQPAGRTDAAGVERHNGGSNDVRSLGEHSLQISSTHSDNDPKGEIRMTQRVSRCARPSRIAGSVTFAICAIGTQGIPPFELRRASSLHAVLTPQAEMRATPHSRRGGCGDTHPVPAPSTSDVSTSKVRPGVLGLAAFFIGATTGVMFFWVGDLSEPLEPRYADYLWRPWPFLIEHETAIGVVSTVVCVVTGVALVAARRAGRMPPPLLAQVIILALFASWLGLGYRVMTSGVIGANIGGGGVWLMTPVFAVVAVAWVLGLAIRASQRAKRITRPDR